MSKKELSQDYDLALEQALADRPYFFDEGLRFGCTGCGACCKGASGTIYTTHEEAQRIAQALGITLDELERRYLAPFRDAYTIQEHPDGRCLFLAPDDRCLIQDVKPTQCDTFPFWFQNLRSRYAWKTTADDCPGIGRGRRYSREEILEILDKSPL